MRSPACAAVRLVGRTACPRTHRAGTAPGRFRPVAFGPRLDDEVGDGHGVRGDAVSRVIVPSPRDRDQGVVARLSGSRRWRKLASCVMLAMSVDVDEMSWPPSGVGVEVGDSVRPEVVVEHQDSRCRHRRSSHRCRRRRSCVSLPSPPFSVSLPVPPSMCRCRSPPFERVVAVAAVEDVVAVAAVQRVDAEIAVQHVGGAVASDGVVGAVARAVDGGVRRSG